MASIQSKKVKTRVRVLNLFIDLLPISFLIGFIFAIVHHIYFDLIVRHPDYNIGSAFSFWPIYISKRAKVFLFSTSLAVFFYYFIMEILFNRTIGKMITRTKVVSINGTTPAFSQIFVRSAIRALPILNLFDAYSFFHTDNTGLHDRWSDTELIKNK